MFEPLFLVFPGVSLEIFVSFFGGGLTSWEVSFPPFHGKNGQHKYHEMVLVLTVFSNSLLPPTVRISVRTAFPQVRDFLSGSWSSAGLLFLFQEKIVFPLGRPRGALVCICLSFGHPSRVLSCLVPLWSRRIRLEVRLGGL